MQEDSVIDKYLGFTLNEMIENVQQMNDTKVLKKAIKTEEQHISKILDGVNLKIIGTYVRERRIFDEFMSGLTEISFKLKEMYYLLTQGGVAELELVDTLNPFTEGVVFSVRPPKKAWKNITNLSGGEKTLSSLALIFALHHYNPTPIYVMDEIDAALDFRNVSIIAHYIKERTKDAQFTIISLRPEMFELADRLMGIYKVNDLSYSVVISPNAYTLNIN
ncbi:Structural maintenance of chromosomes protein 4 [Entamoeba marina]